VIGLTQKASRLNVTPHSSSWECISDLLVLILATMYLWFFQAIPAMAQDTQSLPSSQSGDATPWRITADKITYDQKQNIYMAVGNVIIKKDDKTLSAESVCFDHDSMEALAQGNVLIQVNQDSLSGDMMDINLNTNIGTIDNGLIFVEKKHFIIQGDKIEKTGTSTYVINHGDFTTCDGDSPDWKITGQKIDVTLEGYGIAKNATFWAKKVPVIYTPYFVFPVNIRRQSGLLAPQFGYSDRNGAQFNQPFYWAINRSSDATFYSNPIEHRGEKIGGEYRYALDLPSKGAIMMDGLDDKRIDDGKGNNSDEWGYSGDNALRTNSDRYWFRMKADQSLPYDARANLDLDVVSDQDYLRDFSSGYTGYNETDKYFESEFGRDIDDKNDSIRENNLNISKIWTIYSFTTDVTWNDNVIARQENLDDRTLQKLPNMRFNGLKQPGFNNLFYTSMESQYIYYYRQYGQTTHRENLYPRLYLPYHYENYLAFEPSIGFLQTYWNVDQKDSPKIPIDAHQHRELYDIACNLSTDVSKIFDVNGESIEKIKHTIIPKLGYAYIPKLDQSEFPQFDALDDINPENVLALSITNLIISKDKSENTPEGGDPKKDPQNIYHQIFRFLIEQPYDFNKANQTGETAFDPLYAEMDVMPADFLTIGTETKWSHQKGKFLSNTYFSRVTDTRGDFLLIEHLYNRGQSQSVYFNCIAALTRSISIYGDYERNLEDDQDISKSYGGIYNAQCWSVELGIERDDNDKKIGFMIHLNGLGESGKSLEKFSR
jgi:LPS-assembly protein